MFRRFGEHISRENWFAVGVELIVLVLGIFLGLQVTDWKQDLMDRKTEAKYLAALNSDLESTAANVRSTMEAYRTIQQALLTLASLDATTIGDYRQSDLDRFVAEGLWNLEPLEVQMPTYEEMVSSGSTTILSGGLVRRSLTLLVADLDRFRTSENDGAQVQYRNIDPYLADHFPMRRFQGVYDNAQGLPAASTTGSMNYLNFITRQETQNRVTMKYMFAMVALGRLATIDEKLKDLQRLISERLAALE